MQRYQVSDFDVNDPARLRQVIDRLYEQTDHLLKAASALAGAVTGAGTVASGQQITPSATSGASAPSSAASGGAIFTPEQIRAIQALTLGSTASSAAPQNALVPSVATLPPTALATPGQLVRLTGTGVIYIFDGASLSWLSVTTLAPSNMVTTNSPQTIGPGAAKSISDLLTLLAGMNATGNVRVTGDIAAISGGTFTLSGPNSGYLRFGQSSEVITLAGTTTDSTAFLIPPSSLVLACPSIITTTLSGGGVTGYEIGEPSNVTHFSQYPGGVTALSGAIGMDQWKGSVATDAAGPLMYSSSKIRVTALGGAPTAGAIRVAVYYMQVVGMSF